MTIFGYKMSIVSKFLTPWKKTKTL